ncbi:MAG: sodium:proton antiporter [Longimicrobiales bacterium]|nr:sodium:proton antiporter [Longimicrobiales bacterium]
MIPAFPWRAVTLATFATVVRPAGLHALAAQETHAALGDLLPVWTVAPFILLLLSIAVLPLAVPHWWERNRNKAIVALTLGLVSAAYMVATHGPLGVEKVEEASLDYLSFIALLASLFVISSGIYVKGSLAGSPLSNTALLGIGVVLANFIGTTGASMVLIRPLLRANERRLRKTHIVVFFIFAVANCGGMLTPLGDPPLFLGFLKGVPFEWTLRLWPQWLFVNAVLLVIFNFVDQNIFDREERERPGSLLEAVLKHEPLGIVGWHNFLFLLCVILVVLGKGNGWGAGGGQWSFGVQEGLMAALGVGAYLSTRAAIREANSFTFAPIVEVAVLFAGIFLTMIAPLQILNARGDQLPLTEPWHFYWVSGTLSSFLDNAPTYLTFAATAAGRFGIGAEGSRYLADFLALGPEAVKLLTAVACGSVMMGANTYIGNAPNFMVKAIAEEGGVRMPSFFGYMAWSGAVLIPTFILVTLVFFRG